MQNFYKYLCGTHLNVSHPVHSTRLCHTSPLYIHEPPLISSYFSPAWELRIQHPLSSISTILPLLMSKPSQPCLSNFVFKLLDRRCPSDALLILSCWSLLVKILASSPLPPPALPAVFLSASLSPNHIS